MTNDPASLQNLYDIVVPPPVPFFPPAQGWYFLFAIALLVVLFLANRALHVYRRNSYRRRAFKELAAITTVLQVAELLKRTALAAYPREQVASLSGEAWLSWLSETGGMTIPPDVFVTLSRDVYIGNSVAAPHNLIEFAGKWIRQLKQPRTPNPEP